MYGVKCKTELSSETKYVLGSIMYSGILKEIERAELSKEVLKEMVDFYEETSLIGVNHLREKLNKLD